MADYGTGFGLEAAEVRWPPRNGCPMSRHGDGDVSPLHAADLSALPAAVVVTAEHHPLGAEGDASAARLAAAGVAVTHRCEPGLTHGFGQGAGPAATAARERLVSDARAVVTS